MVHLQGVFRSALCLLEHGQTCGGKGMWATVCVSAQGGEENSKEKPQFVVGLN